MISSLVLPVLTALVLLAEPKATFLHSAPAQARASEPFPVDGSLTSGDFKDLVLLYRGPGQEYVEVKMYFQYGDLWRGTIPSTRMVAPGVEYYVEGRTKSGERVPIYKTAGKPSRVLVLAPDGDTPDAAGKRLEWAPQSDGPDPPPEATRPKKSSELDDELAMYGAEYSAGLAVKLEDAVRRTPETWTVLTAAQLKAVGARHVYEALELLTGISVSRDVAGFYRAAVRGIRDEANILYLYDGHPLNSAWDGRALASLPVDNLARIEVLRGPGSALEPGAAYRAIVNLVPDRSDGVRAGFQAGLNSVSNAPAVNPQAPTAPGQPIDQRGSVQGHLAAAKAFDFGLSLGLDVDLLKDNGYYKQVVQDGLRLQSPAGYTLDRRALTNVGVSLGYASAAVGKVTLKGRVIDEWRTPLVGQFDVTADPGELRWRVWLLELAFQKQMTEQVAFAVKAWLTQQSTDRYWHQTPPGVPGPMFAEEGLVEEERVSERTLGVQGAADFRLPFNNSATAGVRAEFASLTDYDLLSNFAGHSSLQRPLSLVSPLENGSGVAARRFAAALFINDAWRPIDRLTIQAGARLELVQLPTGGPDRQVSGSQVAVGLSPRLSGAFAPLENLVLKASYERGFRAPTVMELTLDLPVTANNQGRVVGNPSLQPATLDQVEGSLEYLFGVGDAKVRARLVGFYDKLGSPIAAVDSTGNLYPYQNRPNGMQAFGVEAEARLELGMRGAAWVNFSWVRVEDLGAVPTARFITEVPQLRGNAGFTVPLGPFLSADVFGSVHGERRSNARSVLELLRRYRLPPYAVVGAQLRTEPLFEHAELSFMVHNLFDVDYADDAPRPDRMPGGVPREGLAAMLSARVFF